MRSVKILAVSICSIALFGIGCFGPGKSTTEPGDADGADGVPTDVGIDGSMSEDGITPGGEDGGEDADGEDLWVDSDGDGYLDRFDNCPDTSNPEQKDTDGDGVGDDCDKYSECANKDQKESVCEEGTYRPDKDSDGDGVPDVDDNCTDTPNMDQNDADGDGTGDACEKSPDEKFGSGTDSDGDGLSDKEENNQGTDPNSADSDGDGLLDGTETAVGSDPTMSDQACGKEQYDADLVKKPIDVIFSVDTSGSMDDEIDEVENRIKGDFVDIMNNSGVDYRVIMLADKDEVCIKSLSKNGNCGEGANTNTNKFKHIDQVDGSPESEQSLKNFVDYYDGIRDSQGEPYNQYLRSNSFKIFVAVSDEKEQAYNSGSDPPGAAQEFINKITSKSNADFGTPSNRNFRVHGIIGVPPKGGQKAYQPSEPIQNSNMNCSTAEKMPASEHAAKKTKGLRYPICKTNSYDAVFNEIADGAVQLSKIGCELDYPMVSNDTIDKDKMSLQWKPMSASKASVVHKVHDQSNCAKDRFYLDSGKVQLCQKLCDEVRDTDKGKLTIHAGCEDCQKSEEICDYQDNNCNGKADEGCEGCEPETCDGDDNDCDGDIDEGCCPDKANGETCSKDSECCSGWCREDGTCGKPCRPLDVTCTEDSQCCSTRCGADGKCITG